MESAFAHGSALVGVLTSVCSACSDVGDNDYGSLHTVVPKVVVCPSSHCFGVEDYALARKYRLFGDTFNDTVDSDFISHWVGISVASYSYGKRLLTLLAVGCSVCHAVDVALVGFHCDLACCLACFPQPVACVFRTFRKLRDKCDVGAVGRDGKRLAALVSVLQSAEVGLFLVGNAFVDDVAREWGDGVGLIYKRSPVCERGES